MNLNLNLVGDIKCDMQDEETANSFLSELELLMLRYKIDKVDVCWKKFKPLSENNN